MGATASNGINSPMMQKSFVSSMGGPDHDISSSINKPPFSGPINPSYDHFNPHPDQSNMVRLFQKSPQEISQLFDANTTAGGSTMNDMGMFSQMFMGSDVNPGLMMKNNVEQESSGSSRLMHGREVGEGNQMGTMGMVHDFLGVGGSASGVGNLQEAQQNEHQRLELEAMSHQRLSVMNHFQHHLPHGDQHLDKPIWDV